MESGSASSAIICSKDLVISLVTSRSGEIFCGLSGDFDADDAVCSGSRDFDVVSELGVAFVQILRDLLGLLGLEVFSKTVLWCIRT